VAAWKALEHSIGQLIPRFYDSAATDPVTVAKLADLFGPMCNLPEYLKRSAISGQRRPLLEAYIWLALLMDILCASGHIWAGKAHEALSKLRLELEDYELDDENLIDGGEYIQWYSRTAALMDFVYKNDPRCSQRVCAVAKRLKKELQLLEKPDIDGSGVEKELSKIVSAACDLDFKLAKSNAGFYVFMYHPQDTSPKPKKCKLYDMALDEANMEDVYYSGTSRGSLACKVDLVLSPGVIKIGSGVGSEYGTSTVLVKRRVMCLPLY
jgi:hypothetical protein